METQLSDTQSLVQRLTRLENENRRFKRGAAALAAIVSALFLMGQAQSHRTVEAEEFVLKDKAGNTRAKLAVEPDDKPMLTFLDRRGNIPLALIGNNEPGISISRPGTQDLVVLSAGKEFSGLAIYQQEIHAGLTVQKGISGLDLFNENGKPQVTLNFSSLGSNLTMSDPHSKANLSMAVAPALGGSNFSMSDSTGEPRVLLATPGGKPSLELKDKEGFSAIFGSADLLTPSTGRKENTSAACIVLFGNGKNVLWSVP